MWYHGANQFNEYSPKGGQSDYADMMFFSRSINVARRYGPRVWQLPHSALGNELPRITLHQWFNTEPDDLPMCSFIIEGDGGYDFPADTLVIRQYLPECCCEVAQDALISSDDGLALSHEPRFKGDRQWKSYVEEHYDGDVEAWLDELNYSEELIA